MAAAFPPNICGHSPRLAQPPPGFDPRLRISRTSRYSLQEIWDQTSFPPELRRCLRRVAVLSARARTPSRYSLSYLTRDLFRTETKCAFRWIHFPFVIKTLFKVKCQIKSIFVFFGRLLPKTLNFSCRGSKGDGSPRYSRCSWA